MSTSALRGRRVLVVGDGRAAAAGLAGRLAAGGVLVVDPAGSVAGALALLAAEPALDAALMDAGLADGRAEPLAAALRERGVPLVFVEGPEG